MRIAIKSLLIFIFIISSSIAEEIGAKISEAANEFMSNIIPGDGITETSIDLRENNDANFSILATRELEKKDNGNFFHKNLPGTQILVMKVSSIHDRLFMSCT